MGEEGWLLPLGRYPGDVPEEPLTDLTGLLVVVEKEEKLAVFGRVKVHLWA